jgi:hypothetical protein
LFSDCHWNATSGCIAILRLILQRSLSSNKMVLEWIVVAQPAVQALAAQVFSAQGMATAAGFYVVVHQVLFGAGGAGRGGAVLGALYNHNSSHNRANGGAESPLARAAPALQVVLTVTLLGVFLKWPLTSALFAVLWIAILSYTSAASAFAAAVWSSTGLAASTTTTTTAVAPSTAPFVDELMMPAAVADGVDASASSSVPHLSPWVWLGLAIIGSWILCAFVADLLEDSTRTLQHKVKQTLSYLVFTAPKQLVRLVVRTIIRSVQAAYRMLVRPVFRFGAGAVRQGFRYARGGGGPANNNDRRRYGAAPNSPQPPPRRGNRPVYEVDAPGMNQRARRHDGAAAVAAAAFVIRSTPSSSHDADENNNEAPPPEPIVRTLINYWRDPSNKPYWDDNDDDDENDEDFVLEEEEQQQQYYDDDDGDDGIDDDDDEDLRLSEYEQEDGLEVTPRRSSRLWERGL